MASSTVTKSYLVFLGADLTTPSQIQTIANLDSPPIERPAESVMDKGGAEDNAEKDDDEGEESALQTCCLVSASTMNALLQWSNTEPKKTMKMVIPIVQTPSSSTTNALRDYPVPYFLYGTLADAKFLRDKLGLGEVPVLDSAVVKRCRIRMWGQYRALLRGGEGDDEGDGEGDGEEVEGWVYSAEGEEEVEKMAAWMGDRYEIWRVEIVLEGGEKVEGCAFGFCGGESELCER